MRESEKVLEAKLGTLLKREGGWSIKLSAMHLIGIPDRLCLLPGGKMFFVEMKTTGEKPTKIQRHVHRRLREMGFDVEVLDTTEKIIKTIKKHVERD